MVAKKKRNHFADLFKLNDEYIKKYVKESFSKEYYVESFSRLDSLIDSMVFHILDTNFSSPDFILFKLFNKNALVSSKVAKVLLDAEIIDSKTLNKIEQFKKYRNILVHHVDGVFEMVMKESGFYKKKHVCRNCGQCVEEHLANTGEKCVYHYSIKLLNQKLDIGLQAYESLKTSLENTTIKNKNTE